MQTLLAFENIRFVIHLFGALVFAGMSWLYFDASAIRKQSSVYARAIGAFCIALSFLVGFIFTPELGHMIRVVGYIFLGIGVWMEPLSKRPSTESQALAPTMTFSPFLVPLLPGWVGLGYFRRATVGLERHLTHLAFGMYVLMLAEIVDLRRLFVDWNDPRIYNLVREYGSFWILQIALLGLGVAIIAHWVFSYLLRRFETQLTLFLGMITILVFAASAITFTAVMSHRLEQRSLEQAQASMNLLQYSEERRSQELLSQAKLLSNNTQIILALTEGKGEEAQKALQDLGKEGKLSKVSLLNTEGKVILSWGGNTGENLQETPAVKKALRGEEAFGYETELTGISRVVVNPIKVEEQTLGIILLKETIDSQKLTVFSEKISWGIRVYSGATVVAASDISHYKNLGNVVGLSETNAEFATQVVEQKMTITQNNRSLAGTLYIGVWAPLKDVNGSGIGMWSVVMPQVTVWEEIKQALIVSYRVGILVLLVMEIPALFMARYLTRQVK